MTINKRGRNLRVGINGFGRIGRAIFRVLERRGGHRIVHINELAAANTDQIRYLATFDSLYGRFPRAVAAEHDSLLVGADDEKDSHRISLSSSRSPLHVDWSIHGVDVVIEATGCADAITDSRRLLDFDIPYVVVTSCFNDADATVLLGAGKLTQCPMPGAVIAAATCDVVAAAPLLHAILQLGAVEHVQIVTLHPWLNYQPLLDTHLSLQAGAVNDGNFGLGRAATISIMPKATSLEPAIERLFPMLKGRIRAHSYRVPTPVVCYGDMSIHLAGTPTRDDVLHGLAEKAPLIGVTEDALVSVDFVADTRAAVVDLRWLRVDGHRLAIVYAYDNEWGYANYVAEILDQIAHRLDE